jgi:hypothetical protein
MKTYNNYCCAFFRWDYQSRDDFKPKETHEILHIKGKAMRCKDGYMVFNFGIFRKA